MLVFFLGFLAPSRGLALLVILGMGQSFSERLFAGGVVVLLPAAAARGGPGRGGLAAGSTGALARAAAFTAVVAVDLGGGPAEARADLVGHDLDHAALLAVLRLVGALLQTAGDDGSRALGERRGG